MNEAKGTISRRVIQIETKIFVDRQACDDEGNKQVEFQESGGCFYEWRNNSGG